VQFYTKIRGGSTIQRYNRIRQTMEIGSRCFACIDPCRIDDCPTLVHDALDGGGESRASACYFIISFTAASICWSRPPVMIAGSFRTFMSGSS
jgi:hypothetical protein